MGKGVILAQSPLLIAQSLAADGRIYLTSTLYAVCCMLYVVCMLVHHTTLGNGNIGSTGDGSAATGASLSNPSGVVVDTMGNLYIADTNNKRIRKVSSTGIITTVAGTEHEDVER